MTSDTQWPAYIVFDQPRQGKPPFYAGAVHAPDPEMALQNARDVFGRRDDHLCLWVVPEAEIFARTAEELAQQANESTDPQPNPPINQRTDEPTARPEIYHVFQKITHKGTLVHAGEVEAGDPASALAAARAAYPTPSALVWWVFPARAIHRTDPAENEFLFGPAHDKPFRHPSFYPTVTLMREISLAKEKLEWEDE